MVIAICLYKYFPYGGLQRDFMRIASTIANRGHHVRVYTRSWQGERSPDFEYVDVPVSAYSNHKRDKQYSEWVLAHLSRHPVDCVLGFNKMPGLDYYYAADICYVAKVAKEKGFFYRLTGRYKHYSQFENAVFHRGGKTKLLMLTGNQISDFKRFYNTESERFQHLPPGVYPDRKYSNQENNSRSIYREKNGIADDCFLVLQVGSDFSRKGVDRSIIALAALPEEIRKQTSLFVVGQDEPRAFAALAEKLGVTANVHFFAGRDDVAGLMTAADLLIHPAKQEAAGIVLVEAIAAGLPVLVTECCGYAHYIASAQCGVVCSEPFQQDVLNQAMYKALSDSSLREAWRKNARHYTDTQDLFSLPERVADIITGKIDG
ncbi:glycosyltransferase family 4 protein [Cedecea neteri]|uniref:glycosyltransferase family 4 protein n=1 Tax=Cedecea neteri TaxID=158822 RepID=UPI0004F767B5|nr:glycosyltransferase family 4 protein [Cedecea neteri]AIR64563.1 glucosyltransferase I RfaG [Cedecea neteri]